MPDGLTPDLAAALKGRPIPKAQVLMTLTTDGRIVADMDVPNRPILNMILETAKQDLLALAAANDDATGAGIGIVTDPDAIRKLNQQRG